MAKTEIPKNRLKVYRRLQRWRSTHTGRLPIPESLWAAAGELARAHGISPTARALHLEYGKLKQRAEAAMPAVKRRVAKATADVPRRARHTPAPRFVELRAPPAGNFPGAVVKLDGAGADEGPGGRTAPTSGPIMNERHAWLRAQFAKKEVEPNSGLGTAINSALRPGDRLTLFLRQPGAPLDSHSVERALKRAILHRKNSLVYKTGNGANPFDYLTALQKHATELAQNSAGATRYGRSPRC